MAGIYTLQLDVTSSESVNAAVEQIMTDQGRIDILVCNAGPAFSSLTPVGCPPPHCKYAYMNDVRCHTHNRT